jgi:cytochrome d ubiquinol oxidase subunit I
MTSSIEAEDRIRRGIVAYDALMTAPRLARRAPPDKARRNLRKAFGAISASRCSCCAMSRTRARRRDAQIAMAAADTIPGSPLCSGRSASWSGSAFAFIAVMAYFFWMSSFGGQRYPRWALRAAVAIIPAPWIAAEMGWFVAEFGRQPWTVDGVLPTALSVSQLSVQDLLLTLAGFVTFYTILFIIEMGLMLKYIRKGPYLDVEETDAWTERHETRLRLAGGGRFAHRHACGVTGHDPLPNLSPTRRCASSGGCCSACC